MGGLQLKGSPPYPPPEDPTFLPYPSPHPPPRLGGLARAPPTRPPPPSPLHFLPPHRPRALLSLASSRSPMPLWPLYGLLPLPTFCLSRFCQAGSSLCYRSQLNCPLRSTTASPTILATSPPALASLHQGTQFPSFLGLSQMERQQI